jgi:uncharacterized cupredoxin-like copper-binding protein
MRKLAILLATGALVSVSLAACDDDDTSTSATTATTTTDTTGGGGGAASTVAVAADPSGQLAFVESTLQGKAGDNTFEFTNASSTTHDFCVKSADEDYGCSDTVANGTATLDVTLDSGEDYTFYCSVDGHEDAGMEGELTVKG